MTGISGYYTFLAMHATIRRIAGCAACNDL